MNNKKILVTGAFGFIGSHLCELLIKKGYDVIAFDRYNIYNDYGWLSNSKYKENIEFLLGDVRDFDSVFKAVKKSKICFHLAALIGIPYSYNSPLAYIKTNLEGTYNVLEASKTLLLDQVLITSTSETYGSAMYTPIDENHPINSQSPYAASKVAADQLALSYFLSFNNPIKIVRPFNVYGPRQSTRAIIPTIINQIISNKKTIKLGNIFTKRDFTYIEDTCLGFYHIFKTNKFFGKVVNIGSNNNYSIKDICNEIKFKMNSNKKIIIEKKRTRPKQSEVLNLYCDNALLLKNTKWKINYNIKNGLDKTIQWYIENKSLFEQNNYHV